MTITMLLPITSLFALGAFPLDLIQNLFRELLRLYF